MARRSNRRAQDAAVRNRRTLDRLVDRTVLRPLQRVWGRGTARLHRELRRTAARGITTPAAIHSTIRSNLADLLGSVGDELASSTGPVLTESVRGVASYMGAIRELPGPLDDEGVVQSIVSTHRLRLESMRLQTAAALAPGINRQIASVLATSRFDQENVRDIIDSVGDRTDQQWWQIERVVRTETAHAFNTGQVESIFILQEEMPRIMKRWTELVNDATGQPMDKRVAGDSIAMHGQVAMPADEFVMPAAPTAPPKMIGATWPYPPNRPNDRAVVTPWMPGWDIPAWRMQGGSKVTLR